jgi:hypothetical protein
VSSRTTTQCTICLDATLTLQQIRFHCASKMCGGTQVCVECAERYGSETTTALLMAEHVTTQADAESFGALACAVEALQLQSVEHSLLLSRDMLREAIMTSDPAYAVHVDAVMHYHDEAFNTDAYRLEGRMQSARLARVTQELQQRHRALERVLRNLDKRASMRQMLMTAGGSSTSVAAGDGGIEKASKKKKRKCAAVLVGRRTPSSHHHNHHHAENRRPSSSSSSSSSSSDDSSDEN